MKIKVQYFASLRDTTHIAEEDIETNAQTINDLYVEINQRYQFSLDRDYLKISINGQYVDKNNFLTDNDTVMFIPPLSGG